MSFNINNLKDRLPKLNLKETKYSEYGFEKNKKLYIMFGVIVLIILFIGSFIIYRDNQTNIKENGSTYENIPSNQVTLIDDKHCTVLPSGILSRLQSYSYYGRQPQNDFKQIADESPGFGEWSVNALFTYVIKFDENEKFFTSPNLVYLSWDRHFVVRGVLQKKLSDGTLSEQDVEYEYKFKDWEANPRVIFFVEKRILSEQIIIRGDGS